MIPTLRNNQNQPLIYFSLTFFGFFLNFFNGVSLTFFGLFLNFFMTKEIARYRSVMSTKILSVMSTVRYVDCALCRLFFIYDITF
jgi:hypothetical protein